MSLLKSVYNVFRSIIMTVIVLLVIVYVGLYVVLSVPSVQNKIKDRVCEEVSLVLGGTLGIESLTIQPFSEVILTDATLLTPEGEKCAEIRKVAAGIDLLRLIMDRKVVLNYAEIIGLDASIVQKSEGAPMNIQFLIDALSPKDKNKPATIFDLRIRNIVIRDSKASLSRPWMSDSLGVKTRYADIDVSRLRMDLSIPILKNDQFKFDVRNLQFEVSPGINLRGLTAEVEYLKNPDKKGGDRVIVKYLAMELPNSSFAIGDMDMRVDSISDIRAQVDGRLTPSDFSSLVPQLSAFDSPWALQLDALYKDNSIDISEFLLGNEDSNSMISVKGNAVGINKKDSLNLTLSNLHAELSSKLISAVVSIFPNISSKGKHIVEKTGGVLLDLEGNLTDGNSADAKGVVTTDCGSVDFTANCSRLHSRKPMMALNATGKEIKLGELLSTGLIGQASFNVDAEVAGFDRNAEGHLTLTSEDCEIFGNPITGLDFDLEKSGKDISVTLDVSSDKMGMNLDAAAMLAGKDTRAQVDMAFSGIDPSDFGIKGKMSECIVSGKFTANTVGNSVDNMTGMLDLSDFTILRTNGSKLNLKNLTIHSDSLIYQNNEIGPAISREIKLTSDWFDVNASGKIIPSTLWKEIRMMIGKVFPSFSSLTKKIMEEPQANNDFTFNILFKGTSAPYTFLNSPIRPLTDMQLLGTIDMEQGKIFLNTSTPHLLQGKNKIIRDFDFSLDIDSFLGMAKINTGLIFPAKKGDVELAADIYAVHDKVRMDLGLNPTMKSILKGGLALEAFFSRIPNPFKTKGDLAVRVDILPSTVTISDKAWSVASGAIDYSGKRIEVDNFLISHEDQFIKIEGVASESDEDLVKVRLNDIDLEYIFNILNINYVSFGGMATGEVVGSRLLTKNLEAKTKFLHVKDLSYNGAVLGDGDLASEYDIREQKVGIYGVIRDPLTRERKASVDGGVWVTRDSLSFGFDANKVNVGIMKPFVSAFCSDLNGEASGKCKLFGTFSDIDLVGDLRADTLSMKLDFTNTWYHAGCDSVYLHKGVIEIPPLTLYDDEGHTAEFSGWLKHTYFHNPSFNFRLREAKSLLCYDTNEKLNPLWYGTIYGSGHAQINGYTGLIDIDMNMTTEEGSKFYYIISDAEDVEQYSFLTFTDKRKAQEKAAEVDSIPDYLLKFQKQQEAEEERSSNVILSLKGSVTNAALVTLVMDPKAGDNITARGQGALQMDYNLASNDLRMIGTYVLDEGNYNFTLQDIIIKNFNIRKGSQIKFDGDPMKAILDITATYRVNTNLTDLDKSFSTDKELNRTNVPVDAVLLVDGPMTNPDITFDIELPTLTSDVERKVKSLVSTNDMMSRQIIYLLALNRFYTPEYTGGQSNGSEWSSVASSTISSQLSNILSQMTDKLDVAPSFRSDKGDFTDMEFDLALSSRLLNNRLLINGNFGYRDKNTSNTQFVGDFDIEYLLSKNGNLRLKAYNHFNDQNYYLRSALTTQGVGVVFQRDFDRLFRRKKEDGYEDRKEESTDSIFDGFKSLKPLETDIRDSINQVSKH
ncbi:MAG: translocation/assembly module TamB [Muribaculaceae bacterium]|nr:translocation/assembly module TamB [Muribaculaceae bacterium]